MSVNAQPGKAAAAFERWPVMNGERANVVIGITAYSPCSVQRHRRHRR